MSTSSYEYFLHEAALRYADSFLPGFAANEGYEFITEREYDRRMLRASLIPLRDLP